MPYDSKPHKRNHALTLASAHHLRKMGHINPAHHARIKRHAMRALDMMRQAAPQGPVAAPPMQAQGPMPLAPFNE